MVRSFFSASLRCAAAAVAAVSVLCFTTRELLLLVKNRHIKRAYVCFDLFSQTISISGGVRMYCTQRMCCNEPSRMNNCMGI